MARRLVQEGVELYFVASSEPIYGRPANPFELSEMGGRPLTVPLRNSLRPLNLIANTFYLWRQFRRIKPAIVHTRASVMGIVGRIAARLAGVPVVVHHQDDLYAREERLSFWKRWLSGRLEAWLAHRSDHTFVVSNAVAQAAVDWGFEASKLSNVGHDLNPPFSVCATSCEGSPRQLQILRDIGIDESHFVVGAITRLEVHKGIDVLIEAAASVRQIAPHARFLVRGRGPEEGRLRGLVNKAGLSNTFFMIDDWLPDEDLAALYKSFNVFALPTRREGFGMAFAEAMLFGVVPIGPNIPPVNEVISSRTGLLVSPTPLGFSDAIVWAMKNPEALSELRRAAACEAVERWGGTKAADEVLMTYRNLLSIKQ
jgi:glycosyltransferase involved in cell wall biosynthesis